jgi:small-conductance mechanosensitive channel
MLILRPFKVGDFVSIVASSARHSWPVAQPAPEVSLLDINLLGTVIAVSPYCHTDHYWQVYFDTNQAMMRVAKEAGWPAPTPANLTRLIQVQA